MKTNDYTGAIAFFHLAQKARDNDEIKSNIAEAEGKLGGGTH
jgi:hypothetical protein